MIPIKDTSCWYQWVSNWSSKKWSGFLHKAKNKLLCLEKAIFHTELHIMVLFKIKEKGKVVNCTIFGLQEKIWIMLLSNC